VKWFPLLKGRPRYNKLGMKWIVASILVIAVFLCYLPVFRNGFVYDDHSQLERNPNIRDFRHLKEVFTQDVWSFSPNTNSNNYRPIHMFAYLLIYQGFDLQPIAYHIVNLLLLAGTVLILWRILLTQAGMFAAFAGALLFAVHPIHVEPVAWIAGMDETLCGFFVLLSFWFYLKEKIVFSVSSFALAVFSKETALVFPAFIAADYLLFRSKTDIQKMLRWGIGAGLLILFYFFLRFHALGSFIRPNSKAALFSPIAPPVFAGLYIAKMILPVFLNAFYHFKTPLPWSVMIQGTVICCSIFILIYAFRRNRHLIFGWLWFFIFLAPALVLQGVSPVLFADRYLYLPSAGFVMAIVALPSKKILPLCLIAISVIFGSLTFFRTQVWKDDLSLWSDTVEKSPDSDTVNYNLATAYMKKGDYQSASLYYVRTAQLNPRRVEAYYNLAICRYRLHDVAGSIHNLQMYLRYSDAKDPLRKEVESKLKQLSE
jgi:protein O-mannosyl-transferase